MEGPCTGRLSGSINQLDMTIAFDACRSSKSDFLRGAPHDLQTQIKLPEYLDDHDSMSPPPFRVNHVRSSVWHLRRNLLFHLST